MMKAGSFAFFLSVVFVLVSDFAWAQPSIPPSPPPTERQVLYQDVICVDADFTPDADESVGSVDGKTTNLPGKLLKCSTRF
jgi:hypothetical protein